MAKNFTFTTNITCSRCCYGDTWDQSTPDYTMWEWTELRPYTREGDQTIGVFDLCPKCTREVKAWIVNGR